VSSKEQNEIPGSKCQIQNYHQEEENEKKMSKNQYDKYEWKKYHQRMQSRQNQGTDRPITGASNARYGPFKTITNGMKWKNRQSLTMPTKTESITSFNLDEDNDISELKRKQR